MRSCRSETAFRDRVRRSIRLRARDCDSAVGDDNAVEQHVWALMPPAIIIGGRHLLVAVHSAVLT
jgi:hypothetical protein